MARRVVCKCSPCGGFLARALCLALFVGAYDLSRLGLRLRVPDPRGEHRDGRADQIRRQHRPCLWKALVEWLGDAFIADGHRVRDLVLRIVESPGFVQVGEIQ